MLFFDRLLTWVAEAEGDLPSITAQNVGTPLARVPTVLDSAEHEVSDAKIWGPIIRVSSAETLIYFVSGTGFGSLCGDRDVGDARLNLRRLRSSSMAWPMGISPDPDES